MITRFCKKCQRVLEKHEAVRSRKDPRKKLHAGICQGEVETRTTPRMRNS